MKHDLAWHEWLIDAASPPGNGGRGLKRRYLSILLLPLLASPPGNGGRGLKLRHPALTRHSTRHRPPATGGVD